MENGSWFSGLAGSQARQPLGWLLPRNTEKMMLRITTWAGARMAFVGEGRLLIDPKDIDFISKAEGNKEPMKDFKQGSDTITFIF